MEEGRRVSGLVKRGENRNLNTWALCIQLSGLLFLEREQSKIRHKFQCYSEKMEGRALHGGSSLQSCGSPWRRERGEKKEIENTGKALQR